jgi:hypothetical protein
VAKDAIAWRSRIEYIPEPTVPCASNTCHHGDVTV